MNSPPKKPNSKRTSAGSISRGPRELLLILDSTPFDAAKLKPAGCLLLQSPILRLRLEDQQRALIRKLPDGSLSLRVISTILKSRQPPTSMMLSKSSGVKRVTQKTGFLGSRLDAPSLPTSTKHSM